MLQHADVLIACGQGVYQDGAFPVEFRDADVYLEHALRTKDVARTFNYNIVVLSGGFTQRNMPEVSEADGILSAMQEFEANLPHDKSPLLEKSALDSAENVIFGLMRARLNLGRRPIRRVAVHVAWEFKKARFNLIADALGLHPSFYFHGMAPHQRANAGELAISGEERFVAQIVEDVDPLLLSEQMEQKRRKRYAGPNYASRDAEYRRSFPAVFGVIDHLKNSHEPGLRAELVSAFRREVLSRPSVI